MSETNLLQAPRGLKGVIVADTELGDVRGLEGFYHYRQYSAPELAAARTFEDVWYLLFEGRLPSLAERDAFAREVATLRELPASLVELLPAIARRTPGPPAGPRPGLPAPRALGDMAPPYAAGQPPFGATARRFAPAVPVLM